VEQDGHVVFGRSYCAASASLFRAERHSRDMSLNSTPDCDKEADVLVVYHPDFIYHGVQLDDCRAGRRECVRITPSAPPIATAPSLSAGVL